MRVSKLILALFVVMIVFSPATTVNAVVEFNTTTTVQSNTNHSFSLRQEEKTGTKKRKVLKIVLGVVAGLLLIYLLQGSIWLSIIGASIFTFFKMRKWIRNRPPREEPIAASNNEIPFKRSFARKSILTFVFGIVFMALSFILLILAIASGGGVAVLLFVIAGLLSLAFNISSIVLSLKSIMRNEPYKSGAIVILVLSILFALIEIGFPLAALITA